MRKVRTAGAVMAAFVLFAAPAAMAHQKGHGEKQAKAHKAEKSGKKSFERLARNGDNVITRDEWRGRTEMFERLDRNGDGRLTAAELRDGKARRVMRERRGERDRRDQMRFRGMDRNGDGVITRGEWRGNDTSFRNQDRNGDGVLSHEELRPGARSRR